MSHFLRCIRFRKYNAQVQGDMETELDAQQQLIAQKDNNIINLRQQTEVVDGINRELAESSTSEAERTTALEHALSAETQKCENLESLITTLRVNEVSLSAIPFCFP